jgi:hypothetical protein
MKLFKKEPTIEFFSMDPRVAEVAPIVPATHFKPSLLTNSAKELSALKKAPDFGKHRYLSTAKCPGVYNYARHGWILTTWQDILIKTNGDGINFEWECSDNSGVGFHLPPQYADYVPEHPNTLKTVIKINTTWRCLVPEGYFLMEGQVPFTDERRFTTVTGFFSREFGIAQMNVQLLWHVLEGETLIKAGTPIAHYMLVPKKQPKLVVRSANENDKRMEEITQFEINRKNLSNRSDSKCLFAKLFS